MGERFQSNRLIAMTMVVSYWMSRKAKGKKWLKDPSILKIWWSKLKFDAWTSILTKMASKLCKIPSWKITRQVGPMRRPLTLRLQRSLMMSPDSSSKRKKRYSLIWMRERWQSNISIKKRSSGCSSVRLMKSWSMSLIVFVSICLEKMNRCMLRMLTKDSKRSKNKTIPSHWSSQFLEKPNKVKHADAQTNLITSFMSALKRSSGPETIFWACTKVRGNGTRCTKKGAY